MFLVELVSGLLVDDETDKLQIKGLKDDKGASKKDAAQCCGRKPDGSCNRWCYGYYGGDVPVSKDAEPKRRKNTHDARKLARFHKKTSWHGLQDWL